MRISDWSSDVCSADQGSALCPDAGERRYAADVAERRTHGAVQARTGQALLRSAALRVVSRAARGQMADTGHRAGDIEREYQKSVGEGKVVTVRGNIGGGGSVNKNKDRNDR